MPGALNPHRTRIRKFANYYLIDIDIEVARDLTVAQAHIISQKVEDAIKRRLLNVYDIMVHIEPEEVTSAHRKIRPERTCHGGARLPR